MLKDPTIPKDWLSIVTKGQKEGGDILNCFLNGKCFITAPALVLGAYAEGPIRHLQVGLLCETLKRSCKSVETVLS